MSSEGFATGQAPDLPFAEDGGELPDRWREDHEAAEAEIAAGLGAVFDDEDAFDRALDDAAARPPGADRRRRMIFRYTPRPGASVSR